MLRLASLIIIVYVVLSLIIYQAWKIREQEIFDRHIAVQKTTYATTVHLYQTYAETLYEEVINRPEILQLINDAYHAPLEQQAILRGRLYRLLYPAYNRLIRRDLRQLHFHLPDNTSFIRFHRLEKYGDNLTDIRESVRLVNAEHKPIFGFENGRIFCGFRNVFPLHFQGKHIGSVETSVSFKAVSKSMGDAAPDHRFLFVQKQDIVFAKAFASEKEIYSPVPMMPGYVVEDLRILGLDVDDPIFPLARRLDPLLAADSQVQKKNEQGASFISLVTDQGKNYLVTGLPIHNIKDEQVAYILSYEEDNEIVVLWASFKYIITALAFLLLALGFFIRKRQEAVVLLSNNESRLRAITHYMGDALYVNDAEGKIIFSNRAMERQLGYSLEELNGQDAHDLFHRHKQEGTVVTFDECLLVKENMAGRDFENGEDYFQRKDGKIIPVEVKGTPLRLEHGQLGSVVIFRDISGRLLLEADRTKAKKLESIGVLAGGIAHDFNNLLTAIMGNIELARMYSIDNPDAVQQLDQSLKATKEASQLTSQLLTFSKGGAPVTAEVDLGSFLPDVVEHIIAGRNILCHFKIDDDLWPVEIDSSQISLVMEHLLNNAMEAMEYNGAVTLSCRNYQGREQLTFSRLSGNYVRINLEDSGPGIADHHLDRIFDPYFTTKQMGSNKGSGLGLSIVHSIVKKHKGLIEVKSAKEGGVEVSIYLPALSANSVNTEKII